MVTFSCPWEISLHNSSEGGKLPVGKFRSPHSQNYQANQLLIIMIRKQDSSTCFREFLSKALRCFKMMNQLISDSHDRAVKSA
jgi:hypothetical protein